MYIRVYIAELREQSWTVIFRTSCFVQKIYPCLSKLSLIEFSVTYSCNISYIHTLARCRKSNADWRDKKNNREILVHVIKILKND